MKKQLPTTNIANELTGASVFFHAEPKPVPPTKPVAEHQTAAQEHDQSRPSAPSDEPESLRHRTRTRPAEPTAKGTTTEVQKEGSKVVKKFTSMLESGPSDQPVNKVGYYFTRREIDRLDALYLRLKPVLRDQYNKKVTKNEIIRACLVIGLRDWEENQLASELVYLLTSK